MNNPNGTNGTLPRGASRRGERGFSLVGLLVFLTVVMVIGIGTAGVRVSAMRGLEQQARKLKEKRTARSGANVAAASLRVQLPQRYVADLAAARQQAGTAVLSAFDATTVAADSSRPLMSVNATTGALEATGTPAASATSLLGQPATWANRRLRVAEDFAAQQGFGPDVVNVVSITEGYRQPTGGTEDAYVLQFVVDGKASEYRTRPRGEIVLGPNDLQCGTSVAAVAPTSTIIRGTSTAINVTYTRARSLRLLNSAGAVEQQVTMTEDYSPRSTSFTVSPTATETYRVEAVGGGSCSAVSGAVTVTVTDPPCPAVTQFAPDSSNVVAGEGTWLRWNVTDAVEVRLNGAVVASSGAVWVAPNSTTDYTLTATGFGGWCPQSATARVTVTPCPRLEYFDPIQSVITRGDDGAVRWNVLDFGPGVTVTLDGVAVGPMGTQTFPQPAATQTHTLQVAGPGSCAPITATATITVNNRPCPRIINAGPNASPVEQGNDVLISWSISDFTSTSSATLEFNGTTQAVGASGTLSFRMNSTGTFSGRLTVSSSLPECPTPDVRDFSVTVTPPPPASCPGISNVLASASCVLPGTPVQITWDRSGPASGVTVQINGSGDYSNTNSATFVVNSPTTFTVTASKLGCAVSSDAVFVDVQQPAPSILAYDPSDASPPAGAPVTVSYNVSGAVSGDINGTPINLPADSFTFTPSGPTDLVLTTRGGGCNPQVSQRTLHIEPRSCPVPRIDSLDASPPSVIAGGQTRISWSISNLEPGATVRLTGPGVDQGGGAVDSAVVTPPSAPGQYPYTVTAVNPCAPGNAVQQTVIVTVTNCNRPVLLFFRATPNSYTRGGVATVRLEWQADDPAATVSISPLVGGGLPASGFVDITAPDATTDFSAVASNGCGSSDPLTASVTVTDPPSCTRGPVTISGNINNAGNGSINWMQSGSVTTRVVGSNLLIDISYQIVPQNGATINGITLAFGAGFSGYRTSTSANTITYNVGTPQATSFSPSPAQLINTGGGHPPGGYRVTGTLTVPITTPLVNNTIDLRPLIVGSSSMGQFEVLNPAMQGQFSNCTPSCVETVLGTVNSQTSSSFAYQYIEAGNCVTRLSNGDLVWNLSTAQAFAESGNVRHFAQLFDGGGRLLATIDQTQATSVAVRGYNFRVVVASSALPPGSGPPYRATGQTSFFGMAGTGFWPTHDWDTSAPGARPRNCTCN